MVADKAQRITPRFFPFANDLDGILYIVVGDDGEVVRYNYDQVERNVRSFARDGVEPAISQLVQVRRQVWDGKVVASVLVASGSKRPYAFRGKVLTEVGVFIRVGGQSTAARLGEVIRSVQRGILQLRRIDADASLSLNIS